MSVLSECRGEEEVHGSIDTGKTGHGGEEKGGGKIVFVLLRQFFVRFFSSIF